MSNIQYVIDDKNIVTGVIVPIDLWRKIRAQNKRVKMMKNRRRKVEAEKGDKVFFRGMDEL